VLQRRIILVQKGGRCSSSEFRFYFRHSPDRHNTPTNTTINIRKKWIFGGQTENQFQTRAGREVKILIL
jgi:hypothetical protein